MLDDSVDLVTRARKLCAPASSNVVGVWDDARPVVLALADTLEKALQGRRCPATDIRYPSALEDELVGTLSQLRKL